MTDQLLTAAIDHREVGRQLASMSGVDLPEARPATVRAWEARGLALQAGARRHGRGAAGDGTCHGRCAMTTRDTFNVASLDEDEYDRRRLPGAYSQTIHHMRELRKERDALLLRGHAGDRFRAAQLSWFIRNNENYAARLLVRMEELGLVGSGSTVAPAFTQLPPALPAQLDLFT